MAQNNVIVYYSWVGNTELAAKKIASLTGFDIQKIEETKERKFGTMMTAAMGAVFGFKSSIKPMDFSLNGYDNVFLGVQVWGGKTTPAVNSYLKKASFKDKKVWLFVTMGDDKTPQKFIETVTAKIEKKGGKVMDALSITTKWDPKENVVVSANEIKSAVKNWIENIKI